MSGLRVPDGSPPLMGALSGRGGMADAPDLGSGAERRKSSSLFVRTRNHPSFPAVVAQLVERHLAKVEVASPSLVYRSNCGCSSMAELQPSKLATWVRFPSPAPAGREHAAMLPPNAPLAQLVEHLTLNQGVPGSSP